MLVMGVVNVTPDSFSDGGQHEHEDAAVDHGLALWADGADILDIGGESTRPGAVRPSVTEELARVVTVVERLAESGARVSVDTMRAEVAEKALEAGASMINDVSGGLADPDMLPTVAAANCEFVAMHWRGHSDVMTARADYSDGGVLERVRSELTGRALAALRAGIAPNRIILDPGIGFAKTAEHNWELLRGLPRLRQLGYPLLIGASRKSFLGALLADSEGVPRPVGDREVAGHALTTMLADRGVWGVRVHDVRGTRDALAVHTQLSQAP